MMVAIAPKAKRGTERVVKSFRAPFEMKADGEPGSFRAVFATLNVIDRDGDVTVKGAFQDGQAVKIAAWGHNWGALTVGKGVIHSDDNEAWVDGQFNLNTQAGREHYETVKFNGESQEFSYGFDVKKWSVGEFDTRQVRFLEGLDVFEVSPVMLGAGIDTRLEAIKEAVKRGARNSAADMDMMSQVMTHLTEAQALMEQIMGDAGDPPANQDSAGQDGNGGGKSGGALAPITSRSRETTAARIAMELLELDD